VARESRDQSGLGSGHLGGIGTGWLIWVSGPDSQSRQRFASALQRLCSFDRAICLSVLYSTISTPIMKRRNESGTSSKSNPIKKLKQNVVSVVSRKSKGRRVESGMYNKQSSKKIFTPLLPGQMMMTKRVPMTNVLPLVPHMVQRGHLQMPVHRLLTLYPRMRHLMMRAERLARHRKKKKFVSTS